MGAHPGEVRRARAGVHHHAIPGIVEPIHDQVIEHAALLVQHAAVQRLTGRAQLCHVVGEQPLEQGAHACALEVDDPHVRDIEHAGGAAHRVVLADLRAVLHRHVPAGEVDQACAELLVQFVERGLSSHGSLSLSDKSERPRLAFTRGACRPSVL